MQSKRNPQWTTALDGSPLRYRSNFGLARGIGFAAGILLAHYVFKPMVFAHYRPHQPLYFFVDFAIVAATVLICVTLAEAIVRTFARRAP
jgi:glycerol uptake facilitator-like aquaporin